LASGSGRLAFRNMSIRMFRAMVNTQVEADALAASNCPALRQTLTMVSWTISSAIGPSVPWRSMKDFKRGAKYSNNAVKASRSPRAATAAINASIGRGGVGCGGASLTCALHVSSPPRMPFRLRASHPTPSPSGVAMLKGASTERTAFMPSLRQVFRVGSQESLKNP